MRILIGLLLLTAALVVSGADSTAGAVTLMVNGDTASTRYQRWADQAAIPMPAGRVDLYPLTNLDAVHGACYGAGACFHPGAAPPRIYLWAAGSKAARHSLYHELGHYIDFFATTEQTRMLFMEIMGSSGPWITPGNAPSEQFAEAAALCASTREARESSWDRWSGRFEAAARYRPTRGQHRAVCRLLS